MSVPSNISVPPQLQNLPDGTELVCHGPSRFSLRTGNIIYPSRHDQFSIWEKCDVYIRTSHSQKPKPIDVVVPWTTVVINTVRRELVTRLAGGKDRNIKAESRSIVDFHQFLKRIADSVKSRDFIAETKRRHATKINTRVNERVDDELGKADLFWKTFYPECIEGLWFTPEEQKLIEHFSWEWKSNLAAYPYYCRSWIVVSAIFNMVYIPRK